MKVKYALTTACCLAALFVCVMSISNGPLFAATMNLSANVQNPWICGNNVKEPGEQCDGPDFGGGSCSAVGFTGGSLSCSNSCKLVFAACTTDADAAAVTDFPTTGGSYDFSDGAAATSTIVLPTGSFPDPITAEIFPYPTEAIEPVYPSPEGTDFVGKTYVIYFVSSDGEVIHHLNEPATIAISYTDESVAGIDPSTLAAYRRDSGDEEWTLVPGSSVDPSTNTVTFATADFSFFALFGRPPAPSSGTSGQTSSSAPGVSSGTSGPGTGASFQGASIPGSLVYILRDGAVVGSTRVNADGRFAFIQGGLIPGDYNFGFYAMKPDGSRTRLETVHVSALFGKLVTIDGLAIGVSKNATGGNVGNAGNPGNAAGGQDQGVRITENGADVNGDGPIDLIDFSILAYWYGRPHPPTEIDLNHDGKIDLSDFSILAYYWTG